MCRLVNCDVASCATLEERHTFGSFDFMINVASGAFHHLNPNSKHPQIPIHPRLREMAVAAYASLVSLLHVLDNVQYRTKFGQLHVNPKQIETLQIHVQFLLDFVEAHSQRESRAIKRLFRKVAEVAHEVEQTLDLHVVHQLNRGSQTLDRDLYFSACCNGLEREILKIDLIKKEMLEFENEAEGGVKSGVVQPRVSMPCHGSSSADPSSGLVNDIVVGFDEHVVTIMDKLTNDERRLQILAITGMGGIGKTTLAKKLFHLPYIDDYFYMRIWLTVSEFSSQEILVSCLSDGRSEELSECLDVLGEKLYKKLFGRKYLIVMDDVWNLEAWKDLKKFFPDNRNGSRIIMTTRLTNVVVSLVSKNPYPLTFLDDADSWNLLCQKIFRRANCPSLELEQIGKHIARSCGGLPLEIIVLGGLLANAEMTVKYWEFVAENISSFKNVGHEEHCLRLLSLSYKHLPIHLKPCFLHMRVFRKDYSIRVSELIRLWIANGLVKSKGDRSLEEIATEYVEGLIDRNLIFIHGNAGTYGMHDLIRDLCLRESENEDLIQSSTVQCIRLCMEEKTCFHCSQRVEDKEDAYGLEHILVLTSTMLANPRVCDSCKVLYSNIKRPRLVRMMKVCHAGEWTELLHPTNVRYFSIRDVHALEFSSPSMIHVLWSLQYLIISHMPNRVVLPLEIWEMPQLRQLDVQNGASLSYPNNKSSIVLKNLQIIRFIKNLRCTRDIVDRIPNLKKLRVYYKAESGDIAKPLNASLCNLAQLCKLESLYVQDALENNIAFPDSLKILKLWNYCIAWEDMSIVGKLSNLEELAVYHGMKGSEWDPVEGEFLRLKVLKLAYTKLVRWGADQVHFPCLERLEIEALDSLQEIPPGIGDIVTLNSIILKSCNSSVMNSAKEIWEEQESLGNNTLQILFRGKDFRLHSITGFDILKDDALDS